MALSYIIDANKQMIVEHYYVKCTLSTGIELIMILRIAVENILESNYDIQKFQIC